MSWPNQIIGYHAGRDSKILEGVVNGDTRLLWSVSNSEWLGRGVYFWAFSLEHARRWETYLKKSASANGTGILRVKIELGDCLNLFEPSGTKRLKEAALILRKSIEKKPGVKLPENRGISHGVPVERNLDCALIETANVIRQAEQDGGSSPGYDSVISFGESGPEVISGSTIRLNSHIQVCVRNWSCLSDFGLVA